MAITVKHNKVSTVPDGDDTSVVRPSDWNADHTLVGTIDVPNGGTGASTLTGYVKGNGTSAMTASATIPSGDVTGLGTMSTQNANAVAITGGTINGTTIGATTPSSIVGTTITGQTGVLRGTGQNLLRYSQTFTDASWSKNNETVTGNTSTAPNGTTTASTLTTTSISDPYIGGQASTSAPVCYSFYAKQGGASPSATVTLRMITFGSGVGDTSIDFNFSTQTFSGATGSTVNFGYVDAGSGWYRIFASMPAGTSQTTVELRIKPAVDIVGRTVLIWGAQLEVGNTANTYIPTTTTAVYGTPTLSFSGVSTIGLQSNGALFLQPAGTGAIQAQATTSTTAGGNVRGANAVDWQTSRATAAQVASGFASNISGGYQNTASGTVTSIAGGTQNTGAGGISVITGGIANATTATNYGNSYSFVGSGYTNTAGGVFNFIGGGYTNSGTSASAVTTQSGTMNATTAVTLSGSNANIKVGQVIAGTSISSFPPTYVAAISGTSLTLSQAASGSSTSTLSFFTPHGVVVGGGNNQATGSYSFIGGGGDAGTAANRNVASGDWSFVGGGLTNTASGIYSSVFGGRNSSATGGDSHAFGASCAASATAAIAMGFFNTANGVSSAALGGTRGIARSITGNAVFAGSNTPIAAVSGVSQAALLVLGVETTDATATALRSNTSAAGTTNQVILPNNSAYFFRGEVVSGKTAGGDAKGWTIEGVIKRGANAASTALVGIPTVTSTYADLGASTWDIAVTADTTNGGLRVTFTGQAATTIRTVARINTVEMTF